MPDHYGTVTGFREYHDARGNTLPPSMMGDDDFVAAKLLVASEWIDARFRSQFPGRKVGGREQVREWPRDRAVDIYDQPLEGIPREIENATYEAALIEGGSSGTLSMNWTPGKYKSVSVDGAVSVEYAGFGSLADVQAHFAIINEILSAILTGGDGNAPYIGVSIRR